jgi:hypothetical protein
MLRIFLAFTLLLCSGAPALAQKVEEPDSKDLEAIFGCMSAGLPQGWKKTWVVVTDTGTVAGTRNFEAQFFYAMRAADTKGSPLKPCNSQQVAEAVYALNKYLPSFEQRQWKEAKLVFSDEGRYNLSYDYSR